MQDALISIIKFANVAADETKGRQGGREAALFLKDLILCQK